MTKKYFIQTEVTSVQGQQIYSVIADSEEEALKDWDRWEFEDEILEVHDTNDAGAEIIDSEDV